MISLPHFSRLVHTSFMEWIRIFQLTRFTSLSFLMYEKEKSKSTPNENHLNCDKSNGFEQRQNRFATLVFVCGQENNFHFWFVLFFFHWLNRQWGHFYWIRAHKFTYYFQSKQNVCKVYFKRRRKMHKIQWIYRSLHNFFFHLLHNKI